MGLSHSVPRSALQAAARLRPSEVVPLAQVAAIAVLVEVALRRVPITRLAGWLGVNVPLSPDRAPEPTRVTTLDLRPGELRKARLARRLMRHWPFGPGPCLRESLVLGHALRRHGPVLRLGVARNGSSIAAHAWLEVGGVSLEADQGYLPLGR